MPRSLAARPMDLAAGDRPASRRGPRSDHCAADRRRLLGDLHGAWRVLRRGELPAPADGSAPRREPEHLERTAGRVRSVVESSPRERRQFGVGRAALSITSTSIETAGEDSDGIVASGNGFLSITSGSIDTLGGNATGIDVDHIAGDI